MFLAFTYVDTQTLTDSHTHTATHTQECMHNNLSNCLIRVQLGRFPNFLPWSAQDHMPASISYTVQFKQCLRLIMLQKKKKGDKKENYSNLIVPFIVDHLIVCF